MSTPPQAALPARCRRVRLEAPAGDPVFPVRACPIVAVPGRTGGPAGEEPADRLR